VGSIAEPALDAVSLVELIYLQGQARAAARGRAGDSTAAPALRRGGPEVTSVPSSHLASMKLQATEEALDRLHLLGEQRRRRELQPELRRGAAARDVPCCVPGWILATVPAPQGPPGDEPGSGVLFAQPQS